MAVPGAPYLDTAPGPSLPWVRWSILAILLLGEVVVANVRLSGERNRPDALCPGGAGLVATLLQTHYMPRAIIAAFLTGLLLAGGRLRRALQDLSGQLHSPRAWRFLLILHLLAFAGYWIVTVALFEGPLQTTNTPGNWLAVRRIIGLAAMLLLGAAAVPVRFWPRLVKANRLVLGATAAVGIVAAIAGQAWSHWWQPLAWATLQTTRALLELLFGDVVCNPNEFVVGTTRFSVHIAAACSGYEGIGLVWAVLGGYLWLHRRNFQFPHALLLFPLASSAIWLVNTLRIAGLVAIGTWGAPTIAVTGFHSQAGWIGFLAVSLGLVTFAQGSSFFGCRESAADAKEHADATAAYLLPLLGILAVSLLTIPYAADLDRFYAARVLAAGLALWWFRGYYAAPDWNWSWSAVGVGMAAFALWMAQEPAPADNSKAAALGARLASWPAGWAASWLGLRAIGSVAIVPVAEELAFRGYLARRLIRARFDEVPIGEFSWLSFVVSSVVFGCLHGRWLAGTLAGMLFALVLYRRRSLADAMVATPSPTP